MVADKGVRMETTSVQENQIVFEDEYFEDEVRDGFFVPSICKRAWACELELLAWLHAVCIKYELKYTLDWGSIIGGVRHWGFVPWDDDIDVAMLRSDYNKLREVAEYELPEGWAMLDFHNSDRWTFTCCLTNTSRMNFEPDYMEAHHNFPYIATIDIFILDNISDDEEYEEARCGLAKKLYGLSDMIDQGSNAGLISDAIYYLRQTYGVKIAQSNDLMEVKHSIFCELERIFTEKNDVRTDRVGQFVPGVLYQGKIYERRFYENIFTVPFENIEAFIPMGYGFMLFNKYWDYAQLRYENVVHNYPYFDSQRRALGEDIDFVPHYELTNKLLKDIRTRAEKKHDYDVRAGRGYKEIVFIPYESKYWYNCRWDDIYRKVYAKAEAADYPVYIYVIPSPIYTKDVYGRFVKYRYDLSGYPEDVVLTDFREYDFAAHMPDEIYVQNPYDEFNMAVSIHPDLYASKLREYTDRLIYVPYFSIEDFELDSDSHRYNMQYYVRMPGVVLADTVYLESAKMVDNYVGYLTDIAGEDTEGLWKNKIITAPSVSDTDDEDGADGQSTRRKKCVMYFVSPSPFFTKPDAYIRKIKDSLETFKEYKDEVDIKLVVCSRQNNDVLQSIGRAELSEVFKELIKDFEVIDADSKTGRQHEALVRECCAYYGFPSVYSKDFIVAHKPVMIQKIAGKYTADTDIGS